MATPLQIGSPTTRDAWGRVLVSLLQATRHLHRSHRVSSSAIVALSPVLCARSASSPRTGLALVGRSYFEVERTSSGRSNPWFLHESNGLRIGRITYFLLFVALVSGGMVVIYGVGSRF
ncbi:hypothetical protein AAHA92_17026 [Salvia divinorum]|uniref:Uncharacterized protein n=1 Tax=Salvia divinorum TaxID=28513 RepID=A0ABD1H0M0_SALDI